MLNIGADNRSTPILKSVKIQHFFQKTLAPKGLSYCRIDRKPFIYIYIYIYIYSHTDVQKFWNSFVMFLKKSLILIKADLISFSKYLLN